MLLLELQREIFGKVTFFFHCWTKGYLVRLL